MRIWKRLLGLALCLCAAVCVMSVSASAAEHNNHPVCGETHTDIGDHTGPCENVTWTEWDGTSEIPYDADTNSACVYLKDSAARSSALTVTDGKTLNLCLNGKTLSSNSTVIEVTGGATLNICDCQGGGEITNTSESNSPISVDPDYKGVATLNLYGGKISGNVKNGGLVHDDGVIMLYNNDGNDSATAVVLNMYGGEVRNTSSSAGIYVSYSKVGTGFFKVNIYKGNVTCATGYGIDAHSSSNAQTHIAGGTVTGGDAALSVLGNLTLSGSPKLIHTNDDGADIDITTSGATTPNDYITVTDDFAPAGGTKVSVEKSVDSSGSVVFAAPAESNKSLSSKAQYFVSAEEGYFVESNSDGNLQLTACAITGQPTAENSYTITANGGAKAAYQWYSAKQGDVPVTDENAAKGVNYRYSKYSGWYADYQASSTASVNLEAFTLHMNAGDKLTLTNAREVENFSIAVLGGTPNALEVPLWWSDVSYTAPADGEYTLTVTARPESFEDYDGKTHYRLNASFKATVTADVPDTALTGQVNAALNTSQLETGSYICKVTWENKTTLNSQTVRYDAAPSHAHSWSSEWTSDATHHWHNCENANCPVKENSGKSGYAEHSGGAATCQAKAVCEICGTAYGGLDANGHDWGEWGVTKPATTSAAGEETRTCMRDKSHTETRAIPKLTPAPSGGGSSGGSSSAPAVTVPVSGSGNTVHVSASVSGSTAEVKEIKSAELDKIGTDSAVVIDLSGLNKGVTGVTLSTDTIDSICKAEADGVTVKLPSAELRVDRQTLAAVTEQAAGSKIRLVVEPDGTARSTMTASQKSTLAGMKNAAVLEAYFVSNDTRIRDFKGGSVELSIPYRADGAIRAWFLKEDGTREPVSARYDKENAQLILHHFSHYVIEELDSSAAYTVCAKDDSCPLGAFGDLTATAWYHDGVHYCVEKGLMHGISADKFLPDGSVTRAQLAAILWRLEGNPAPVSTADFSDVADGVWYAVAVRWAADSGVVKGYADGRFRPNDAVTREQMATLLYRFAGYKGYDVGIGEDTDILRFVDGAAVGGYAVPAMRWACGSGLMTGARRDGGMALAPRDTATRAQTATLLMRFQSAFAKEP